MMKIICLLVLLMNYKINAIPTAGIDSATDSSEEDFEVVIPEDTIISEGPNVYEKSIEADDGEVMDIFVVNAGPKPVNKPQQFRAVKPITKDPKIVKRNCKCITANRCAKSDDCAKKTIDLNNE